MTTTAPSAGHHHHGDNTPITTLTDIHKLEERYPFDEIELEILARCHDHLVDEQEDDSSSFLLKLARASPYSTFFLPGDEMKDRVDWIEDYVLPPGFANELRAAISADAFVEYANQNLKDRNLERFVEGVADTGRRGSREALRILYEIVGGAEYAKAYDIVDACLRLAVASDALVVPNLDREATIKKMRGIDKVAEAMSNDLLDSLGFVNVGVRRDDDGNNEREEDPGGLFKLNHFVEWAERKYPVLSAPLSTFVHHLVFHGHPYPRKIPYVLPELDGVRDDQHVFTATSFPSLIALSFATPSVGGKVRLVWCRLAVDLRLLVSGSISDNVAHVFVFSSHSVFRLSSGN